MKILDVFITLPNWIVFQGERKYTIEVRNIYYTTQVNKNVYTYTFIEHIDVLVKISLQYLHSILPKAINIKTETVRVVTAT